MLNGKFDPSHVEDYFTLRSEIDNAVGNTTGLYRRETLDPYFVFAQNLAEGSDFRAIVEERFKHYKISELIIV